MQTHDITLVKLSEILVLIYIELYIFAQKFYDSRYINSNVGKTELHNEDTNKWDLYDKESIPY